MHERSDHQLLHFILSIIYFILVSVIIDYNFWWQSLIWYHSVLYLKMLFLFLIQSYYFLFLLCISLFSCVGTRRLDINWRLATTVFFKHQMVCCILVSLKSVDYYQVPVTNIIIIGIVTVMIIYSKGQQYQYTHYLFLHLLCSVVLLTKKNPNIYNQSMKFHFFFKWWMWHSHCIDTHMLHISYVIYFSFQPGSCILRFPFGCDISNIIHN